LNVHTQVYDDGAPQTAAVLERGIGFEAYPYDYGDLPNIYNATLLGNGGPRHLAGPMRLGEKVDGEIDGQPDTNTIGDDTNDPYYDDEDGVEPIGNWGTTGVAKIQVTVNNCPGTCYLNAWIDWNNNHSFGTGEQFFIEKPVTNGVEIYTLTVPEGISLQDEFYLRFRLCQGPGFCNTVTNSGTNAPSLMSGAMSLFAPNAPTEEPQGEVEDYNWSFFPTGVPLGNFEVKAVNEHIEVNWETNFEESILGFNLYRSDQLESEGVKINSEQIPAMGSFLPYSVIDSDVEPGTTYYYTLEVVGLNGKSEVLGPLPIRPNYIIYLPISSLR
jgi:hypothetical protein